MTTHGRPSRALTEDDDITEVFGEVDANFSLMQLVFAILVANLITAVIVGVVVAFIYAS